MITSGTSSGEGALERILAENGVLRKIPLSSTVEADRLQPKDGPLLPSLTDRFPNILTGCWLRSAVIGSLSARETTVASESRKTFLNHLQLPKTPAITSHVQESIALRIHFRSGIIQAQPNTMVLLKLSTSCANSFSNISLINFGLWQPWEFNKTKINLEHLSEGTRAHVMLPISSQLVIDEINHPSGGLSVVDLTPQNWVSFLAGDC